jgi:hypothetical protein
MPDVITVASAMLWRRNAGDLGELATIRRRGRSR